MSTENGMSTVDEFRALAERSPDFAALVAGAERHPTELVRWGIAADKADELGESRLAALLRMFMGAEWAVIANGKVFHVCDIRPNAVRKEFVNYTVESIRASMARRARVGDYVTFRTPLQAIAHVAAAQAAEAGKAAAKAKAKADREEVLKTFTNPYAVGDLLYCSWGYDETHYDFAEVTGVGPRSVTVRRIASRSVGSRHYGHEEVAPVKGAYLADERGGKPKVARLTIRADRDGRARVSLAFGGHHWYVCGDRESFHESTGR